MNAFWFRRDLRLQDNHGLFQALKEKGSVLAVFIFDKNILDKLNSSDSRVEFIYSQLERINQELGGNRLAVFVGDPVEVWPQVIKDYKIKNIFFNNDYEPYALKRDKQVEELAEKLSVGFFGFKDQVIFEKADVTKEDGKPYTVFTPYFKKWKSKLTKQDLKPFPSEDFLEGLVKSMEEWPTLKDLGFKKTGLTFPKKSISTSVLKKYQTERNFPFKESTTKMGLHLRFGTLSVRKAVQIAQQYSEIWLSELVWREFFQMILFHFPQSATHCFKSQYEAIDWRNNKAEFKAWCEGKTGYPIVDAGMRELNETGFMHNRVRMITASFLVKHLLIDWRWGERYFAEKLLDFDLAANVGNWQWAAGCGCDAAPYFRVFNPEIQTKKFDPDHEYIRRWVPDVDTPQYPEPIVDHVMGRLRVLKAYDKALKGSK